MGLCLALKHYTQARKWRKKMAETVATYTIVDVVGDTKTHAIRFEAAGFTLAELSFALNSYGAILRDVIDGVIVSCTVDLAIALSGAITTVSGKPKVGSNVHVGANISVLNEAGVPDTIYIPSFDYLLRSKSVPLNANADITALVASFETGIAYNATPQYIPLVDDNELGLVTVRKIAASTRK
jgi:hypothetical protein